MNMSMYAIYIHTRVTKHEAALALIKAQGRDSVNQ